LNSDDQQSTNGLLTPVSLQQINNYLTEGYNAHELFLLYVENITMPRPLLRRLLDAAAEHCAFASNDNPGDPDTTNPATPYEPDAAADRSEPLQNLYCEYLFGRATPVAYDQTTTDLAMARRAIMAAKLPLNTVFRKFSRNDLNPEFGTSKQVSVCFAGGAISDGPPQSEIYKAQADMPLRAARPNPYTNGVPSDDYVSFVNDPAYDPEPASDNPFYLRSFSCFDRVLTVLLALGLQPEPNPDKVLYVLPTDIIKQNPRYLADINSQGLKVAFGPGPSDTNDSADAATDDSSSKLSSNAVRINLARKSKSDGAKVATSTLVSKGSGDSDQKKKGSKTAMMAVCKSSSDFSLSIGSDPYVQALFATSATPSLSDPGNSTSKPGKALAAFTIKVPHANESDPCKSAVSSDSDTDDNKDSMTITYSPRSLEAMVYFLGQIIRRNMGPQDAHSGPVTFLAWSPAPRAIASHEPYYYREELFRVLRGSRPTTGIASASDPTGVYFVPELCDMSKPEIDQKSFQCREENPNHSSAQILTMLNQIWGLNKTQATAPTIPTVNVVGH
jgi:hypothetical protein